MIVSCKDHATEDIFNGENSKAARKVCSHTLWRIGSGKLGLLDSIRELDELKVPPGNRIERLIGNRNGKYSILINGQYRICFVWGESGPSNVEIIDYH